jgi:hypothetical protein
MSFLFSFPKVKRNTEASELEILENWLTATVEDSNLEYFLSFSFMSLERS